MAFDPKQFGAIPASTFNASQFGATPVNHLNGFDVINAQKKQPKLLGSENLGQVGIGLGKGVLSTVRSLGELGQGVLQNTAGRAVEAITGTPKEQLGSDLYKPQTEIGQKAVQVTTPEGGLQQAGFGAEKMAEFLLPGAQAARGERAINLIADGIKNPAFAAATRIVGKGLVQGVSAGLVSLAQTAKPKTALETSATAGIIRGGFATIGEGARAIKLPERLYSMIFKNTSQDALAELKAGGIATLQQKNPELYNRYIESGIIRNVDGVPTVNDTLAEKALARGLQGSIKNMSDEVVAGLLQSEDKVRNLARNYTGTINVSETQFEGVLRKISQEWEDVGFGEFSNEAKTLADKIKSAGGNVDAETALDLRRFLDRIRVASSFDKPVTSMATTQANLKILADTVRKRLTDIPEMASTMKDYSFYIDALDALAKEAKRTGNRSVLGLIDNLYLGAGLASGQAIPATLVATISRLINSAGGATGLAQTINAGSIGARGSAVLQAVSRGGQSLVESQQ